MQEFLTQMQEFFLAVGAAFYMRLTGPLKFRFIIQPLMAIVFAAIDGVRDAKAGRLPYLWGLVKEPGTRLKRLKEAPASVGKVAILAVILDLLFQWLQDDGINLLGSLIAAVILAIVPYMLLRGPVNAIAGFITRKAKEKKA